MEFSFKSLYILGWPLSISLLENHFFLLKLNCFFVFVLVMLLWSICLCILLGNFLCRFKVSVRVNKQALPLVILSCLWLINIYSFCNSVRVAWGLYYLYLSVLVVARQLLWFTVKDRGWFYSVFWSHTPSGYRCGRKKINTSFWIP